VPAHSTRAALPLRIDPQRKVLFKPVLAPKTESRLELGQNHRKVRKEKKINSLRGMKPKPTKAHQPTNAEETNWKTNTTNEPPMGPEFPMQKLSPSSDGAEDEAFISRLKEDMNKALEEAHREYENL
jgi:hypothetical protein